MFEPPKNDLQLKEVAQVADLAFKMGFLETDKILNFIQGKNLLLGDAQISQIIINKSISILDKTSAVLIVSQLQTYYFSFAEKNNTDFILWVIWYLVCKQRFPEMMAFAYTKLITEKQILDRIKKILLEIKSKAKV